MFDSGISAKDLVEELQNEVDIALDIPNATYVQWLNALQQILYTEVIKEQKKTAVILMGNNKLTLSNLSKADKESTPLFEDIVAIYADDRQLIKSTVASGNIFPYTYYKENDDIGYNLEKNVEIRNFTVIHIVRPALIDKNNLEVNVMIPIEFIDLVKAKLRGEAYKLANEDNLAAKWLNDYNVLLETFKVWIAEKSANFGL